LVIEYIRFSFKLTDINSSSGSVASKSIQNLPLSYSLNICLGVLTSSPVLGFM